MGIGDQRHASAALHRGKTQYPLYRKLGGPHGRPGQVRQVSPPPGIDPWTAQPLDTSYTDCATPAQKTVQK
jgi:hypothetical protein